MIKLEKWARADNYLGDDFSKYYIVCGQHRDSNYLEQSNFMILHMRM